MALAASSDEAIKSSFFVLSFDPYPIRPSTIIQSFFILSATGILAANALPSVQTRFIRYGSRSVPFASTQKPIILHEERSVQNHEPQSSSLFDKLLTFLAKLQVPHSWFLHFYIVSVASSVFWGTQIVTSASLLNAISVQELRPLARSMSLNQIFITWLMMLVQGMRRLYECTLISKPSKSSMWFAHWLIGIMFYLAIGVAVWIEGGAVAAEPPKSAAQLLTAPTDVKSITALISFALASVSQHICHTHLSSLKKYSLPTHPLFKFLICPHYCAECAIYVSLAFVAAPPKEVFNLTILSGLLFVVVNLGVTAQTTRQWYMGKFGSSAVAGKWNMIPFVF